LVEIMKDRLANFFNPSFRMNHFYRKNLTLPNMQHLHSALGYVTPAQRRAGEDKILFKKRNQTIEKARERYPQRWGSRKPRAWKASPTVILNPDKNNDMDEQPAQKAG
jgi:hypothetical protein